MLGLGASQPGRQWTPDSYHPDNQVGRVLIPYQYVVTHSAVAASTADVQSAAVQISQWPFLWTTLHVGQDSGDEPADAGFLFSLTDNGRGQVFMSAPITSRNLMAEGPIPLPVPWLFGRGASIRSEVENLDTGTAYTCRVTLGGWLVEPSAAGKWDEYGITDVINTPFGYPLPAGRNSDPVPFFYNVRTASIAASSTGDNDPAFQVGTRPFSWFILSAAQEAGTSGVGVTVTDNRTRQGFSSAAIPSRTLLEHGPLFLPAPWYVGEGGSFSTTVTNYDTGAARRGRVTFGGVLQ